METDINSTEAHHLTAEQWKAVRFLREFSDQMVQTALGEHKTSAEVLNLVEEIYQVCDQIIAGCLKNGEKVDCKMGCAWCCYMRVKVTPIEILSMITYLRKYLKPRVLFDFQRRLAASDEITRGMDGNQRVLAKIKCPLLVDPRCLAYPARPIACRVFHSLDSTDCKRSLDDPGHSLSVRHDISGMGMGIHMGLIDGLHETGLQGSALELNAGLQIAMDSPENEMVERWLRGETILIEAQIERDNKM